jgi:hypothetical protein
MQDLRGAPSGTISFRRGGGPRETTVVFLGDVPSAEEGATCRDLHAARRGKTPLREMRKLSLGEQGRGLEIRPKGFSQQRSLKTLPPEAGLVIPGEVQEACLSSARPGRGEEQLHFLDI